MAPARRLSRQHRSRNREGEQRERKSAGRTSANAVAKRPFEQSGGDPAEAPRHPVERWLHHIRPSSTDDAPSNSGTAVLTQAAVCMGDSIVD
uniref:Uncharacterized protein n=1 Tax=Trichuris muris TaxID=70415 RepID=A0A5S6R3H0_TRIMR